VISTAAAPNRLGVKQEQGSASGGNGGATEPTLPSKPAIIGGTLGDYAGQGGLGPTPAAQ